MRNHIWEQEAWQKPKLTDEELRLKAVDFALGFLQCDAFTYSGSFLDLADQIFQFIKSGKK